MSTGNGYDDNGNPVQYGFGGRVKTCEDCIKLCKRISNVPAEYCLDFEPKEKPMTDKIQLTEEQANEIYHGCILERSVTSKKCFISGLKELGYIRKSELETLVDEAEDMYKIYHSDRIKEFNINTAVETFNNTIQALKKEVERVKK